MTRSLVITIASGALLSSGLFSPVRADGSNIETKRLHPVANVAYVPAGADLSTIQFEKAGAIGVPTKLRYITNAGYCLGLAFRDPGGSASCPSVVAGSLAAAYEVTYSFDGRPTASDESGGRRSTFQVYFRPEDLTAQVRQALSARKRADLAEYFQVETHREVADRTVIDDLYSSFCEGDCVDGNRIHRDAQCSDHIAYKTIP